MRSALDAARQSAHHASKGTCDAPRVSLSSSAFSSMPRAVSQISATASSRSGDTAITGTDGDGVFGAMARAGDGVVPDPTQRQYAGARGGPGCAATVSRALDIAAPVIEVASVGSPAQVCGNNNGGIDKGERFNLPVTLRNSGNVALPAGARALFAPAPGMDVDAGPNAAGYVGVDSCAYGYVDISRGANAVEPLETYVANGNAYGPRDDARSSEIVLGGNGITLYGQRYRRAVMSTNKARSTRTAAMTFGILMVNWTKGLGPQLRLPMTWWCTVPACATAVSAPARAWRRGQASRMCSSGTARLLHQFVEIEGDFKFSIACKPPARSLPVPERGTG